MKIKLKDVRIAFIDSLFVAKEYKEGDGKPRYSATFVIDPSTENHKAIEDAIAAGAKEAYGAKADAMVKSMRGNSNKFCYNDGSVPNGKGKVHDGFEGMMYVAAHRQARDGAPLVIGKDKQPLAEQSGAIYGGCYVNAVVDIYLQKGENPGVRCALVGVQFSKDCVAFSGSRPSVDDFDDLADTGEDLFK